MQILHVSDYFNPSRPGGGTRLLQAHLSGLSRRGHQVSLLAGHDGDPPEEAAPGVPMLSFRYPPNGTSGPLRSLRRIRSLWREIAEAGVPDVVVFHQPLSANLLLDLVGRAPIVYMFHSPWSREHLISRRGPFTPLGAAMRRTLEGRAVRRAHRVITLSRYMRGEAQRLHRLRDDRFALIPGGVDLDRFHPAVDREALRRRLGVPPGLLIFTLRRLVPRMGVGDLVRAVGTVSDSPRPVSLWVGGEGPEGPGLRRLAESVGRGRVRFLGTLGEAEAADIYAAADIFVVPSRDLEGFGLATLEALASGTPVIATPAGANREVLSDLDPALIPAGIGTEHLARKIAEAQSGRWCDAAFRTRCRRYAEERYPWSLAIDRFESLATSVSGTRS